MPNSLISAVLSPQYDGAWTVQSSALSAGIHPTAAGNRARTENAAREFESTLLAKWLEQARHAFAAAPEGEEGEGGDEPGQGEMLGLGIQSLASAITKSGGFGIAQVLCRQLQGQGTRIAPSQEQPGVIVGKPPVLTEINPRKD